MKEHNVIMYSVNIIIIYVFNLLVNSNKPNFVRIYKPTAV